MAPFPGQIEYSTQPSTAPVLQWEKFGEQWIGIHEQDIVCVVGVMEGPPCKAYALQYLNNTFVTADAAMAEADRDFPHYLKSVTAARVGKQQQATPFGDTLLDMLKVAVAILEKEKANRT